MENSRRTPNLYLAAYLVCEGISLLSTELKKNKSRAIFVFENSPAIPILEARFYEGEARVEPRGYSFIIKDLKARVEAEKEKHGREGFNKSTGHSNVSEPVFEPALGSQKTLQENLGNEDKDILAGERKTRIQKAG